MLKKSNITLLLMLISSQSHSQVGIATTNPQQMLHINGSATGLQTIRIDDIAVTSGGTNSGELTPTTTTTSKALYADSNGDIKVRSIYGDNTQSVILSGANQTITSTSLIDITGATITFTPKHPVVYLSFAVSGYNPLTGSDPRSWVAVGVSNNGTNVGNFLNLSATNDSSGSSGACTVSVGNFPLTVTPGVSTTIKLRGRVSTATSNGEFTINKTNYTSYMTILD